MKHQPGIYFRGELWGGVFRVVAASRRGRIVIQCRPINGAPWFCLALSRWYEERKAGRITRV